MKLKTARKILAVWNRIESEEPDISTERLMAQTGQETGFDDGDVAQALLLTKDEPPTQ